jgi:acyl-CoA synthetase (AMP-forming)/AMP-acid ligase II
LDTLPDDPAAIIFTSGSTGAPKGVLYTQRMFDAQVAEIQSRYDIQRGGVDLACFPLFALFNAAMGVTTVLPEMDFSRPASANPTRLLSAANDWRVTQAFASPAVWRMLGEHCRKTESRIDSLRQVFSCGAPVTADVMKATLHFVSADAQMHTPYGATECLPLSTIEAAEVLKETAEHTRQGSGVCVGRKFDSVEWRVIRISDGPIASIEDTEELPIGEIGELIVRGPQVSPHYVTRAEANALAKIADTDGFWHRTGDVGYFDDSGRFWYCGRKSQRVETRDGTLFTECVEAILNTHPHVSRTALVGLGPRGQQEPAVVYEPKVVRANPPVAYHEIPNALREIAVAHDMTRNIRIFLPRWRLPVDIRHNAKINREQLADWAARKLAKNPALA